MKATLIKTAVEWFNEEIKELFNQYQNKKISESMLHFNRLLALNQAQEMEKEQIVKHSVELTKILISNPFETSGKTPTELMDNYFKEIFKKQD